MEEILVNPTKEIRAGFFRIKNNFRRIDTLNRRSLHDKVILLFYYWSFFSRWKFTKFSFWFLWLKMTVFNDLGLSVRAKNLLKFGWSKSRAKIVHPCHGEKTGYIDIDDRCWRQFVLVLSLRWPFWNVVDRLFYIEKLTNISNIKMSPISLSQGKSE